MQPPDPGTFKYHLFLQLQWSPSQLRLWSPRVHTRHTKYSTMTFKAKTQYPGHYIINEGIVIPKSCFLFYLFPKSNYQMLANEESQREALLDNMCAF